MTAITQSHCVSFREIPRTSKLFSSFLEEFNRVAAYYAHPPTAAGIDSAAKEVRFPSSLRDSLVEILRLQNARFGPADHIDPATSRNLDRLSKGAVAIVTGQQVGLFSGPAYTFYKALTAVRCAEDATLRGTDAVPIFWLATSDHDLAEVNHAVWNTRGGTSQYALPSDEKDAGRSVGEVALGEAVQALVATAEATLEGPFGSDVARTLREAYAPGETYGSAFGKLMARLLAGRGIIFIDPSDPRLQRIAAPVYQNAIDQSGSLRDSLLARSKELERVGFHAQVKVTHETTLLFCSFAGRREPLHNEKGNFVAGDTVFTKEQLMAAVEKTPEAFSPNALLRPVVQDTLLPTAAYVGGPAEVAYFAQARVIYEKLLGRMPAVLPRASFTIIEPGIARFLDQYGLGIRDMLAGPQHVRTRMEQKALPDAVAREFQSGEETLRTLLRGYEAPLAQLDSTLVGALRSTEEKMLHQFNQLRAKVGRAENFRSGVLDRHERILFDSVCPDGHLQERTLCALPWLAAHGPELLDEVSRRSSISGGTDDPSCAHKHQVLYT